MSLFYLVCVVFVASIGLVNADTSKAFRSKCSKIEFHSKNNISISVSRLLRSHSAANSKLAEERAGGLSVPGFKIIKGLFSSSKTQAEKLESWLKSGKSADAVFTRLHLHDGGNLFFNPQFVVWIKYADDLSARKPSMSAISTLTRQYGDDVLFRMIETAKMHPNTENIAKKLEVEQIQHWLTARKDPDAVFQLFKLNKMGRNRIFEKPEFATWVKYVDDLNTKYPEEPTWMYLTMTNYFNDETLFKLTDDMKWSDQTKTVAIKLEDDWLQAGLQSREISEKVLVGLGLGKTTDSLLESPLFSHWAKYTAAFNKRYPEEKATMIETLTKNFGDIEVTKMLHTAKSKKLTKTLATELESAQLKMWLDSGKSTDDVFKLLQLDKYANTYDFKDKVVLGTWISYISVYTTKQPDEKVALFSALEARLKDKPLNEVLNMAKKFSNLESTATKIQTNKILSYLASNVSPRSVFTLLRLADEGDDILGTPLFQTWMKYVKDYNKRNPNQQESWFDTIRIKCEWGGIGMIDKAMENPSTVEIGKKVERGWLNYWLDSEKPPEVVFKWLDLPNVEKLVLADPRFKTWTTYLDEFNQRYPAESTTVIDGLRANYNDGKLLNIFKAAMKYPSTKKLTTDLENALINKWFVEEKSVELLHNRLGHVDSYPDMIKRYEAKLKKVERNT